MKTYNYIKNNDIKKIVFSSSSAVYGENPNMPLKESELAMPCSPYAAQKASGELYLKSFHESYGFSWIVTDIDPTYTLGDMARKRLEIIRQLKEEGVFELQKELRLPMFCQRIAVISSANAAGYGDFVNQLESNEYGFRFHTQLFPAIMQGEGVEQSVIAALNKIFERLEKEEMPLVLERIASARAEGDLSENAEYHGAREHQALLKAKIDMLKGRLSNAQIIDPSEMPQDEIRFGATIVIKNLDDDTVSRYTLVGAGDEDFAAGKILSTCPLAQGFLGKKAGDVVEIQVPVGLLKFKIQEVFYEL